MAVLFALITLIGWALGDLFAAVSTRLSNAKIAYFWAMTFAFLISSFYIPFAGEIKDPGMFILACFLNIIHMLANLSALKGFEVGKAAIVGTLSGTSTVLTILISIFLFAEYLSRVQVLGILLILLGGIFVSFNFNDHIKKAKILTDRGIIYGLLAMAGWGIYFALVRIPAEKIGWFWAGYPLYPMTLLLLFFMKDLKRQTLRIFSAKKILFFVLLYTIFMTAADFSYNLGILRGFTSIVSPIADSYPVLFIILARYVFKEHLTGQQKTGILITMTGIVLTGLSFV